MLSLFLTKVLRPPPTRVGRITNTLSLPRAIPAPQFAAAIGGGVIGLLVGGIFIGGVMSFVAAAALGAFGVWIVSVRPWRGENVARVGMVKLNAWRSAQRMVCPGSYLPVMFDPRAGSEYCGTCGLLCDVESDDHLRVASRHEWKREVYVGCQRIKPEPPEIRYIPGSVEIAAGQRTEN